jgi:hypothetical protein
MSVEYYSSQKSRYEGLLTYLCQKRREVDKALGELETFDLSSIGVTDGIIFGKPLDVYADYSDITAGSVKSVIGKQREAVRRLDTAIGSVERAVTRYSQLLTTERERIREEQARAGGN